MTTPEVIAYLDMLENKIRQMANDVRQLRYTVFNEMMLESLDNDTEELVD